MRRRLSLNIRKNSLTFKSHLTVELAALEGENFKTDVMPPPVRDSLGVDFLLWQGKGLDDPWCHFQLYYDAIL